MSEKKPFVLRISKDLFDEIQAMAAAELRSVNGQIEYILREAVAKRRRPMKHDDDDRTDG